MYSSLLVGLTLAVTEEFRVLFAVLVFHRTHLLLTIATNNLILTHPSLETFEGLGVGSRLADMALPHNYNYVPMLGACLYGITTPIGVAVGLGVRASYNPASTTASIVSGILDAFSAGILIYTGLVEVRPVFAMSSEYDDADIGFAV